MNNKETGNTDIWNILLKKVHGKNLKNFNVLDKKSDLNCYYQIFEVLVAETLNICDRNTVWTVSGFHNDGGIDLKGIDKHTFSTPFVPEPIRGISIGQIKRRASGHKFDSFIDDLTKINNYCFKKNIYDEYCLVQVLYILSSDKPDNVKKIKKRYAEAIQNHEILSLNIAHNSKLNLIDANNIINTWKLYHNYFSVLLEDALDESELSVFNNYFTTMDFSIISIAQSSQSNKDVFVGEDFLKKITISCSIDNLYVPLYVKWHTVEPGKIQLIYPLQALDPRKNGYKIYINKNADLIIKMRCIEEGLINCGNIELYSEDGECIACVNLNTVNVISNFEICHFTKKNIELINDIKRNILSLEKGVSLYRIVGNGGIGKSTVINEVMMHIANMDFMCMSLSHHKDKTHENDMLKSMFKEIIYPFNKQELFHYDSMPDDIRIYLRSMYIEKWNKSIINFFSDSNDYSTMDIAQCLASVIISELQEQNILIWLSDLHWADQKTFTILKNTFQCLIENQENLKKRLCIIIEGRSNEALLFADTITIPRDWELFYNSSVFKKYEVKLWDEQTCIDYLKDVFRVSSGEISAYYSLFDQLILHSNGNPMHLNEHIHMLINNDYLKYDHNIGIRINKAISDEILTDQILELIRGRILFCRKKYSYLADVLTAIALSDADMHPELQKKLYLWLMEKNTSIEIILKQNGFVKYDGINRFQFIHENYLNAFKEETIQSDELINIILDFYKGLTNKSEKEELFEIRTCIMQSQYDYNELYVKAIDMIKKSDNLWIKYELYSYLSKIPADKNLPQYIPDYIVYFECCELLIKFGSWETAANNLDKTLLVAADYSNPKLIIYLLKAYQELANIQCDQMKFDAAIESSESGIEIAEIALKQNILKTYFSEIQRLYEKLLARLAVCYWFSGDIESAVSIQKNCLKSAQKNKDSYSENHTKYEYGTIQFHFDIASGISEMEDVLKESKSILELEKYEKTLIEVQLLIGKLMLANKTQDAIQIKEVKLETKRLSEYYKYNPHTYEEFLCATIRGCTFILNDNNKEAYKCFMKSLEFATAGEMPNLEWKAYYNIAQCYILFNDKNNAVMYAEKSLKIIENSIKNSPNQSKIFEKHIEGTIKHLRNIINFNGYYIDNKDNLLSIYYKNLNFVIMN